MSIGQYSYEVEESVFEFLVKVQAGTVIDKSDQLGLSKNTIFSIKLKDPQCKPVQHSVRKCSKIKQDFIDSQLEYMMSMDVVAPILSNWCSAVVVVPKPGPGDDFRLCMDVVDLNELTEPVNFPIPCIDDILCALGGANWFCKLDLAKGYWQVGVDESTKPLLTLITRRGTYCFKRMPFGPRNAPAVFQSMMHRVLGPQLYKTCFVFFDDIVVFGSTESQTLRRTDAVIELLSEEGLKLSGLKSDFLVQEVELLGHIVKNGSIYPKVNKLQALVEIKRPSTVSEARSLYGLLSYYRKFIEHFAKKVRPLSDLLRSAFEQVLWTEQCEQTLLSLIRDIEQQALMLPDFTKGFILATDFSYEGVSGVLSQIDSTGKERPVMFASRSLTPPETKYAPIEGEALAIVWAIKRFEFLLRGHRVIIRTDHKPLIFMKSGCEVNRKLARWWSELQGFDYTLEHVKGRVNIVPDGLSRLPSQQVNTVISGGLVECDLCGQRKAISNLSSAELDDGLPFWYCLRCQAKLKISDPAQDWNLLRYLQDVNVIYEFGPGEQTRVKQVAQQFMFSKGQMCHVADTLVRRVLAPRYRLKELSKLHSEHGHVGIFKLYHLAKALWIWPKLWDDCAQVVRTCSQCQRDHTKLKFTPMISTFKFNGPFECWSMDLIPSLPTTVEGFNHILIVVDYFSKWIELLPLKSKSSAEVAFLLDYHIISRFGLPVELRCDNGKEFYGETEAMCLKLGIQLNHTSVAHPQANGQSERYVGVVKHALSKLLDEHADFTGNWVKCLPAILRGLRFGVHKVLGIPPFTLVTGRLPHVIAPYSQLNEWASRSATETEVVDYIDSLAASLSMLYKQAEHRLGIGDDLNKARFDSVHNLLDEAFSTGQLVLMKNRNPVRTFRLPLAGPYLFNRYLNASMTVAELQDCDGKVFPVSVSHLVPFLSIE